MEEEKLITNMTKTVTQSKDETLKFSSNKFNYSVLSPYLICRVKWIWNQLKEHFFLFNLVA